MPSTLPNYVCSRRHDVPRRYDRNWLHAPRHLPTWRNWVPNATHARQVNCITERIWQNKDVVLYMKCFICLLPWEGFLTSVQSQDSWNARDHLNFMFVEFIGLAISTFGKSVPFRRWCCWGLPFSFSPPPPLGNPSFICIVGFRVVKVETV